MERMPMKRGLILIGLILAWVARGEGTNAVPVHAGSDKGAAKNVHDAPGPGAKAEGAGEDRVALGGIAVASPRGKNPLQLINPLAPRDYGAAGSNLSRDPVTGRVSGLKLLSIQF